MPTDPGTDRRRRNTPTHTDHTSVFVRQLPFATVGAVIGLAALAWFPQAYENGSFFAGVVLILVSTIAAIAVPWHRIHHRYSVTIPVLDMLAVGMIAYLSLPALVLLLLPVLWLATVFGTFGLTAAIIGGIAMTVSAVLAGTTGFTLDVVQYLFLVPGVLAAAAVYIHLSERRSIARRTLIDRQSAVVEDTLEDARAQRVLLDSILNTIDVGVVALDETGRITTINRSHARLSQGRLKVGDHATVHGGIDGYYADGITPLGTDGSPLVRAARGQDIPPELTFWQNSASERAALRVSAAQLTDNHGERMGAVVVYQDLTEETAALARREEFVSSVSHELRTPLTSVLGYLELAIDHPQTPQQVRAQLEVAERNAQRLLTLTTDLLVAARISSGQIRLDPTEVDLSALIAEAAQSITPWARSAGITVVNETIEPCPLVADRDRLAQVLDNVLSNALKYTPSGGHVRIRCERRAGRVTLEVADTGIGIAPDDQQRIFSRFYRTAQVRGGPIQGSGLGLHLAAEVVRAHGGTIEVESELGSGTLVQIRLVDQAEGSDRRLHR